MTTQRYALLDGGRIKAAAVSLSSILTKEHRAYLEMMSSQPARDGDMSSALVPLVSSVRRQLKQLQNAPTNGFVSAYFPEEPKRMMEGMGLYRPTLKSDQGVGGNFIGFRVDRDLIDGCKTYTIVREHGYAVPETSFMAALEAERIPFPIEAFASLQRSYRENDLQAAYGDLGALGSVRRAVVGRAPAFLIRPVTTDSPVIVGTVAAEIEAHVNRAVLAAEQKAEAMRREYLLHRQEGTDPFPSIELASKTKSTARLPVGPKAIYFQPDIILQKGNSFLIERINLPDVGMFLNELDSADNPSLQGIQGIARILRKDVCISINQHYPEGKLHIVAKDEVARTGVGDTLEVLEIQALKKVLEGEHGRTIVVTSPKMLNGDEKNLLILNPDNPLQELTRLFELVYYCGATCYPDPFLKFVVPPVTDIRKVVLTGVKVAEFLKVLTPPEKPKDEDYADYLIRVKRYLMASGITEEIIHVATPSERTPYATTLNPHGLSKLYHRLLKKQSEGMLPQCEVCGVPFKPEDSLIYGEDGPRYNAFRFMMVRRE